ncbi:hypothetical protein PAPYR_6635 [Paratrimastix pyriformis]|uniref:Tafazzin family protein n=1 Tax=Paratrimastix pyriformis TaxID=342808 RepID=A0ABQ8UJD2_9EUKA|nr:hypothetical protein PAPYR_6635 [Paratrimastix pyriformis]
MQQRERCSASSLAPSDLTIRCGGRLHAPSLGTELGPLFRPWAPVYLEASSLCRPLLLPPGYDPAEVACAGTQLTGLNQSRAMFATELCCLPVCLPSALSAVLCLFGSHQRLAAMPPDPWDPQSADAPLFQFSCRVNGVENHRVLRLPRKCRVQIGQVQDFIRERLDRLLESSAAALAPEDEARVGRLRATVLELVRTDLRYKGGPKTW